MCNWCLKEKSIPITSLDAQCSECAEAFPSTEEDEVDADDSDERTGAAMTLNEQYALRDFSRLIQDAIDSNRAVRIDYFSKSGVSSRRVVEPRELFDDYFDAWCHLRREPRRFRLQGIRHLEMTHAIASRSLVSNKDQRSSASFTRTPVKNAEDTSAHGAWWVVAGVLVVWFMSRSC